jgi:hypothetical protein
MEILLFLILLCLIPRAVWSGLGWIIICVLIAFVVADHDTNSQKGAKKEAELKIAPTQCFERLQNPTQKPERCPPAWRYDPQSGAWTP